MPNNLPTPALPPKWDSVGQHPIFSTSAPPYRPRNTNSPALAARPFSPGPLFPFVLRLSMNTNGAPLPILLCPYPISSFRRPLSSCPHQSSSFPLPRESHPCATTSTTPVRGETFVGHERDIAAPPSYLQCPQMSHFVSDKRKLPALADNTLAAAASGA